MCSVPGCNNKWGEGYKMRHVPANAVLRAKWEKATLGFWKIPPKGRVCEMHFETTMWEDDGRLKYGAVPTIFNCFVLDENDENDENDDAGFTDFEDQYSIAPGSELNMDLNKPQQQKFLGNSLEIALKDHAYSNISKKSSRKINNGQLEPSENKHNLVSGDEPKHQPQSHIKPESEKHKHEQVVPSDINSYTPGGYETLLKELIKRDKEIESLRRQVTLLQKQNISLRSQLKKPKGYSTASNNANGKNS